MQIPVEGSGGALLRLLAGRDHATTASATQATAPLNSPAPVASGDPADASLSVLFGPGTPVTVPAPGQVKSHVRGRVCETETGAHGIRVELTEVEIATERTTHLALGRIEDRVLAAPKERGEGLAA